MRHFVLNRLVEITGIGAKDEGEGWCLNIAAVFIKKKKCRVYKLKHFTPDTSRHFLAVEIVLDDIQYVK